jgi:hypothetical protein
MPVSYGTIFIEDQISQIEVALGYAPETITEEVYFNVEVHTSGKNKPSWGYEPPEYEELDDVNLNSVVIMMGDTPIKIDDKETLDVLKVFLPEDNDCYWNIVEENV